MELTPAQRSLPATDEGVEFYRRHGYHASKKIFTDEEIEEAVCGRSEDEARAGYRFGERT